MDSRGLVELATVVVERTGEQATARVTGELDMCNARAVRDRVLEASGGATSLTVDLAGVTFMDSSGLAALADLRRALLADSRSLHISTPQASPAARILLLSGMDQALDVSFP